MFKSFTFFSWPDSDPPPSSKTHNKSHKESENQNLKAAESFMKIFGIPRIFGASGNF